MRSVRGGRWSSSAKMSCMKYDYRNFRNIVMQHWRAHGRHTLPWRRTDDPYAILVSEIMLQQTQVERVMPYFTRWMKQFPTVSSLARVPLSEVLKEWSGLGYNRRAKMLHECAKKIVTEHAGEVPRDFTALIALPGIGPYTAGAIRSFAFDEPSVLIETNIRAALIHHFFPHAMKVSDRMLLPHAEKAMCGQNPRTWNAALMDYGAYIKKTNPNPSRRSAHHTKQEKFEGSLRQMRGAILRLHIAGLSPSVLKRKAPLRFEEALRDLRGEGLLG